MLTIEELREKESGCIKCIMSCQDKNFLRSERLFRNSLQEIRRKIQEFYETTILD